MAIKIAEFPLGLQQKLDLDGTLYRVDTLGDGSCLAHAFCKNINPLRGKDKKPGLLLRDVMAQFCKKSPNMRELKKDIQNLETMLQRKLIGFRKHFNLILKKISSSVWSYIWKQTGNLDIVPKEKDEENHLKKYGEWMNVFDIVFLSKLAEMNILFVNHEQECFTECKKDETSCKKKCVEPSLYCGISNYEKGHSTMLISWIGNSHFEATVLKRRDGKLQSLWKYGTAVPTRLMHVLHGCKISTQDRLR